MIVFRYIRHTIRIIWLFIIEPFSWFNGSRKLRKYIKKNKKEQNPNLYPFEERWKYITKKVRKFNKRMGIKINVVGEENLPKGASWITPNHSSNFDPFYVIDAIGGKLELSSVVKDELKNKKRSSGYIIGSESFPLDRSNLRSQLQTLTNAAKYSKRNNRGMVVFPEGTRSLTGELLEFKCGIFKFPQKFGIPIVPITITGTLQARKIISFKTKVVTVKIHKPIKSIEHIKLPTEILCRKVRERIQSEIDNYEKKLSPSEKKSLDKLKVKSVKKDEKKNRTLEKEISKKHEHSKNNN